LECNYALYEEDHWRLCEFCFRDDFKGVKPNMCQELNL
jgi:hypothetical protein